MSVWILQVCNEWSFATNSRGSNYPSGDNTHLLPERNCNQMPKTLAEVLLDVDHTVRRSEGLSLQSATMLQEAMKTPTQHNSSRQKGWSQKTDLYFTNGAHKKEFKKTEKAEDKEMLMSMWLRHAKGSHQCSQILNWESCQQIWSACLVAIISQGCALPAPYSQQWNRAHLPAQRYKHHSTGPKLSITHQCIMKDGW